MNITHLMIAISVLSCANAQDINTGLVTNFRFDSDFVEQTGTLQNVVLNDTFLFAPDRFGNPDSAIQFTGSGGYQSTANGLSVSTSSFSVSFWYSKSPLSADSSVIRIGGDSPADLILDVSLSASPDIYTTLSQLTLNFTMASDHAFDTWYHVAFVLDAAQSRMSLFSGGLPAVSTVGGIPEILDDRLRFGYGGITMDDLRVYNRALSESDVEALFTGATSIPEPSSYAAWAGLIIMAASLKRKRG